MADFGIPIPVYQLTHLPAFSDPQPPVISDSTPVRPVQKPQSSSVNISQGNSSSQVKLQNTTAFENRSTSHDKAPLDNNDKIHTPFSEEKGYDRSRNYKANPNEDHLTSRGKVHNMVGADAITTTQIDNIKGIVSTVQNSHVPSVTTTTTISNANTAGTFPSAGNLIFDQDYFSNSVFEDKSITAEALLMHTTD
jgi:hypothetical protein